jgi:translocation and assembly module TamB
MKRRLWLLAGATLVSGAALAIGPGAPWLVDTLADGQRVWRLGRLQVHGVSGAWLGDLHAQHLSIADDDGVWLEAEDVSLRWRPFDLAGGAFVLDHGAIEALRVLRRPALSAPKPNRTVLDIQLHEATIRSIELQDAVLGLPATLTARFGVDVTDNSVRALTAHVERVDADTDFADISYRSREAFALRADMRGATAGVFSRLLGVPEHAVQAEAQGDGNAAQGTATYAASIGDVSLLAGQALWSPDRWQADTVARLDLLPALRPLAQRIGAQVSAEASGAPAGAFTATATTPHLAVNLSGDLEDGDAFDSAHLVATTPRLSGIAHESPFELGAARLVGEVRRTRGTTAIEATLDAQSIELLGQRGRLSGPLHASLNVDRFALDADLQAPDSAQGAFASGRLRADLAYERGESRFLLRSASFQSDAIALDGQGRVVRGDGEFSGAWRTRKLEALTPSFAGEASGRWRAFDETIADRRAWTVALDGRGQDLRAAQDALAQVLGATPRLDARLRIENGGVTVAHARADGDRLRAGATGRVVRGEANLALEASAQGPVRVGDVEVTGALDATGQLTGRFARPTLTARATLSGLSAGALVVNNPVLDLTIAPQGDAYAGRVTVQGAASGQPLTASADLALNGAVAFQNIDGQWGGVQAQGAATLANAGVSADLDVNGVMDGLAPGLTGRVAGQVALTPDTMALRAEVADARYGDVRVRTATVSADGPLDSLNVRFDMRGRLRQAPLTFAGEAQTRRDNGARMVFAEGRGELAGAPFATRAPIEVRFERGVSGTLDVMFEDGALQANWRDGRALAGTVNIDNAPLAPLAAIWGERATGRISGRINLANAGRGLTGDTDVRLSQARFAGRQRGTLDLHIVGELDPNRLAASIDATSTEGLVARFEADAPVTTSAAPIRIALAQGQRGRARWSVRGPADSLWAAARLPDQTLSGQLDGAGQLQFGAGYLAGDGQVDLTEGRFEDKRTGITLTDLDARLRLSETGISIDTLTATSPHGGRLTATGGSTSPTQGAISARIDGMRIVDRPDARAVASGDLTLAWEGFHSTLSGALAIAQADLDIAANPEAGIPTIDVIEVNRPIEDDDAPLFAPAQRNGSTELDIRLTAPGRVFTRGRGVEAEWALDLRLDGTARSPRLFGDARAVRGTLALSGQPFEIESARIFFNGDPLDAQIDMSAVRDTADLSARVRFTGTAREPELAFSSDPPLPGDEILPQVLFGRGVADLSAFEAAQLAASLAALSGNASLNLMDAARAAAGLDRFNVRQDEDGGFLVAGGVYLTRDVYVELARTGLGQAQTRVEWTVRPRLVLITSFRGDGDQRVSLRWRRESD